MHILKNNFSVVAPFFMGVACVMMFSSFGSRVLSGGIATGAFVLIPLAYMFFLIGIITTFVKAISYITVKKEEEMED